MLYRRAALHNGDSPCLPSPHSPRPPWRRTATPPPSPRSPSPLSGPVWAHRRIPIPIEDQEVTKSVMYRNYIVPAAVDAMWEVLAKQV